MKKEEIVAAISALADASDVRSEDEFSVEESPFKWKESTADFAGRLIGAHNRRLGCRATATFDTRAIKLPGVVVL